MKPFKKAKVVGKYDNGSIWVDLNTEESIILANDNVIFEFEDDLYIGKVGGKSDDFDANEARLKSYERVIK